MMTRMQTQRWFLKCKACKKAWAVDTNDGSQVDTMGYPTEARVMTCPECGNTPPVEYDRQGRVQLSTWQSVYSKYHTVMGKVGSKNRLMETEERCKCDARCTNARGPNCECSCGGANHGSNKVVTVQRDVGPVPVTAN